jgi:sigma-B regulation protein RsbU (phosphoserine phosphatase)
VGIMPRAGYTSAERPLSRGDRFLLYTDGLVEGANGSDEFFGEERVREVLAKRLDSSPESCAGSLVAELERHTGRDQGRMADDDLTVVVIDVL